VSDLVFEKAKNHFVKGVEHCLNEQWLDAESQMRESLRYMPDRVSTLINLSSILIKLKKYDNAKELIVRALEKEPHNSELIMNSGLILFEEKNFELALEKFNYAIKVNDKYLEAHLNRGNSLVKLNRLSEALESFNKAIEINKDYSLAHSSRNSLLQKIRLNEVGIENFNNEKLKGKTTLLLRALELHEQGLFLQAKNIYEKVLLQQPNNFDALNLLGVVECENKEYTKGVELFEKALSINDDHAEVHYNLGIALQELKFLKKSIDCYSVAIAIKPDYADAYFNRGVAFNSLEETGKAIEDFESAINFHPDPSRFICQYLHSKMEICDWRLFSQDVDSIKKSICSNKFAVEPFMIICFTDKVEIHKQASEFFSAKKFPINDSLGPLPPRQLGGKTKIAFLSADFSEHPMGYNFVGFFENLDRSKFEVIAVSFIQVSDSPLFQRLVAAFDVFKMVDKLADSEVCQWMREQQIDIAVDMMGPTLNNRQGIFAMRCAPVQVNQFSWTSGAPYMDYIIADPVSMPKEYAAGYSEKLAYVPHTLFATDDKREVAEKTPQRSEENLPEQGIVFCCFNNSHKITPEVFDVWMRVLQKVPNSVLWIRSAGDSMEKNLNEEAKSRGVDPKRLVFAARVPSMKEHLARYRLADLFLDTFPFCAQTTASDALWAGVPVVTCVGESSMSRICASLLHALDMPELVTGSLQEYEGKVLELAKDRAKIQEVRKKLQVQKAVAPLFNTALYTRNIENAYRDMIFS
jgi:predicted O-linked N-acetylglucosamine transferase (SPINDLY family)